MPRLLARRYRRKHPSRTERVIGAVVLGLTVVVVGAVVLVSRMSGEPLFQVSPGSERPPRNRGLDVARAMMPPLGTAGWSPARDLEVLSGEPLREAGLTPARLDEFDVRRAYRGRYVRLGDGSQSVQVLICDATEPPQAFGLYKSTVPEDARPLNVGCEGWQTDQAGAFWAGRYATAFWRRGVTEEEPSIRTIADALAGAQIRYGWPLEADGALPAADRQRAFPDVDLPDWRAPADAHVYTPVNLWEKIDGRAEIYLQYQMVRLTFGTYRYDRDPTQFVDVYGYDMGEPDNAFGIYRAEMSAHPEPIDIGRGGYASPGGLFFWKGGHYVRVETADTRGEARTVTRAIAEAIARQIRDDGRPLWADAVLPQADRVEGSFEYHAKDAFSLEFLSDVFSADYRVDGRQFKAFIHRAQDESSARRVFDAYASFLREFGSVGKQGSEPRFDYVVGESGGTTDAVFVAGRYVGGITGAPDAALAEQRMIDFARSLPDTLAGASPPR